MELLLATLLGLGLSAACGFRIFVPLLILSVSSRVGWVALDPDWQWVGQTPALVTLGVATVLEIGAYYIPVVDNLLDGIAAPAAIVAGTLATASMATDFHPLLQWSVALIGGGGLAGTVHLGNAAVRTMSTVGTAGIGNPFFSTLETLGATALSFLSLLVPIFAALAIVSIVAIGWVVWSRKRKTHAAKPR